MRPDEDQARIVGLRHIDGQFALADFVLSYHSQSNDMFSS